MDAIMHLICTVILDLCVISANSMFNWSNAELEQHQVFPGIFFPGGDATFNIISSNYSEQ